MNQGNYQFHGVFSSKNSPGVSSVSLVLLSLVSSLIFICLFLPFDVDLIYSSKINHWLWWVLPLSFEPCSSHGLSSTLLCSFYISTFTLLILCLWRTWVPGSCGSLSVCTQSTLWSSSGRALSHQTRSPASLASWQCDFNLNLISKIFIFLCNSFFNS